MVQISFTSSFLKTVYIPHNTQTGEVEITEASIVELSSKDKNDIEALGKTSKEWQKIKSGYAPSIYYEMFKPRLYPDVNYEKILALTTQNEDYNKLDYQKILGLAVYSDKTEPVNEISWLQTNPKTNFETKNKREYKELGKKLVDYMKEISDKPLYVQSSDKAIKFYEKQGFEAIDDSHPSIMIYEG